MKINISVLLHDNVLGPVVLVHSTTTKLHFFCFSPNVLPFFNNFEVKAISSKSVHVSAMANTILDNIQGTEVFPRILALEDSFKIWPFLNFVCPIGTRAAKERDSLPMRWLE